MARTSRQSKIIDIITKEAVETQDELLDKLKLEGFDVTQATVSRDIKELRLVKVMRESRKYRYAVEQNADTNISIKMMNMFRESVISIDYANNLVVLKTIAGSANAAATLVDKLGLRATLGCIAGDDAVLIVARTESDAASVVKKLEEMLS